MDDTVARWPRIRAKDYFPIIHALSSNGSSVSSRTDSLLALLPKSMAKCYTSLIEKVTHTPRGQRPPYAGTRGDAGIFEPGIEDTEFP